MLRIAHISDLHIRNAAMDNESKTLVQEFGAFLLRKFGIDVQAGGHDEFKLEALKNRMVGLRPDVIVVTGDLTNFGDKASFEDAVGYLRALRAACGASRVLCIPGNHDCLVERLAASQQEAGWFVRILLAIGRRTSSELRVMNAGAKQQFGATKWSPERVAELLSNYRNALVAGEFGACDPASPVRINAGWGEVAFFLFDSVNEPGLMANKGRIGIKQFNQLNTLAQNADHWASIEGTVRIALLHHHPISAPHASDGDASRIYDWMDDGPLFLATLNARHFHFVLHGHQHEPFNCRISYGNAADPPTHVVAAGSATQGSMSSIHNSFNVIDLVSPFEAVLTRYDMERTGYRDDPSQTHFIPLGQLDRIRVSRPNNPETVEDWAIRSLVQGSGREFIHLGEDYEYARLEFDVAITAEQRYIGKYRRIGTLRQTRGAWGLYL